MVSKKQQRQRRLAREKQERQQARRTQRHRKLRRRGIIVAAVAIVLALVGGFGVIQLAEGEATRADPPRDLPTSSPSDPGTPESDPGTCSYLATPSGGKKQPYGLPPEQVPDALLTGTSTAKIETDRGTISIVLDAKAAPCAVNSFAYLAEKDAYADGQCSELAMQPADARYLGCTPGKTKSTYLFPKEHEQRRVGPGRLVLAGVGQSNSNQVLLTYGRSTFDSPVTVLGTVDSGVAVLKQVAEAGLVRADSGGKRSDKDSGSEDKGVGRPKTSVVIEDVKVTTRA